MPFEELTARDTQLPDFRVSFVAFEAGQARISLGVKRPSEFTRRVMVETTLDNMNGPEYSPWDDFYSRMLPGPSANQIPDDDLGRYQPGHAKPYVYPTDKMLEGGEFVIPLDTEIYFWVRVPCGFQRYTPNILTPYVGSPSLAAGGLDPNNLKNSLRIEFGTVIPNDTPVLGNGSNPNWTYTFFLPIFKIKVTTNGVDLQMYDIGECVYISEDFAVFSNHLNFSRASSFYD